MKIVLFDNSKKRKGNEPSFAGTIKNGDTVVYTVALWPQVSAKGTKYLSGTIEAPKPVEDGNAGT